MKTKTRRTGKGRRVRVAKAIPIPAHPFVQHSFEGKVEFLDGSGVPMVLMTREAYSQMWHFVDLAAEEVSWLGTARITPYGNYLIEEVFLLEQQVSATETELSSEGQAKLAQHLMDTRPDGVEAVNKLRFWGHSHVRMRTSPSHQDEQQMQKLQENGCPWFIRGILNKLGRMEFTIYLWAAGVKITDVPWAIYERVDASMRAGIEAEFQEKVSRATYTPHAIPMGAEGAGGYVSLANALALQESRERRKGILGTAVDQGGTVTLGGRHYDDRTRFADDGKEDDEVSHVG